MQRYVANVSSDIKHFDIIKTLGAAQAGYGVSASQQLGLTFQQNQYNKRVQALTQPANYARDRETAFNTLAATVDKAYTDALEKYIASGMPTESAKQFALQAADNERRIQQQVMEVEFPSGANAIELGRSVGLANSKNYPGGVSPQPGRRAPPARRRAGPKRRR